MKKIIMFSGKAESGKDTLANITVDYLQSNGKTAKIVKFGDILKMFAKAYFGWNGKKDEDGRKLLQDVADKFKRNTDKYFFAELLADIILTANLLEEYIIISDLRFLEEVEVIELRFHQYPKYIIRVERPEHINALTDEQKVHNSEIELDDYENFDYVISGEDIDYKIEQLIKFLEVI